MVGSRSILLVEDSDADSEATVRALKKCPAPPSVYRYSDGDSALAFLRTPHDADGDLQRPGVILLDLNLPGTDGRDVLDQLKADDDLKHIPVVILTTSADRSDVSFCYRHGASGYMTKPINPGQFADAIRDFCSYWFQAVVLPEAAG